MFIWFLPCQGQVLVGEIPSASVKNLWAKSLVTWTIGMTCPSFPSLEEIWGYSLTTFFLESVQIPFCWSWNPNQSLFIRGTSNKLCRFSAPSIRGYIPYFCSLKYSKITLPFSWPPFSASPHNTWSLGRGSWLRETGIAKAANLRWKSSKRNPTWISRMIFHYHIKLPKCTRKKKNTSFCAVTACDWHMFTRAN